MSYFQSDESLAIPLGMFCYGFFVSEKRALAKYPKVSKCLNTARLCWILIAKPFKRNLQQMMTTGHSWERVSPSKETWTPLSWSWRLVNSNLERRIPIFQLFQNSGKYVDVVVHNWTHVPFSKKTQNERQFDCSNWTRRIGRYPTGNTVLFSKIPLANGHNYKLHLAHSSGYPG